MRFRFGQDAERSEYLLGDGAGRAGQLIQGMCHASESGPSPQRCQTSDYSPLDPALPMLPSACIDLPGSLSTHRDALAVPRKLEQVVAQIDLPRIEAGRGPVLRIGE